MSDCYLEQQERDRTYLVRQDSLTLLDQLDLALLRARLFQRRRPVHDRLGGLPRRLLRSVYSSSSTHARTRARKKEMTHCSCARRALYSRQVASSATRSGSRVKTQTMLSEHPHARSPFGSVASDQTAGGPRGELLSLPTTGQLPRQAQKGRAPDRAGTSTSWSFSPSSSFQTEMMPSSPELASPPPALEGTVASE